MDPPVITAVSRPYHHGNLRAALVEAGMALLATRALDDISLREVARAVGVSATAVYRHFPDKRALLVAMAAEGLAQLAKAQRLASDEAGGGAAGFDATGRAYVRFALAHPALFRLIFANPPPRDADGTPRDVISTPRDVISTPRDVISTPRDVISTPRDAMSEPAEGAVEALAMLRANAASFAQPGTDPAVLALRAWSIAHGLAMLMLDGQVPAAEATIDAVLDAALGSGCG